VRSHLEAKVVNERFLDLLVILDEVAEVFVVDDAFMLFVDSDPIKKRKLVQLIEFGKREIHQFPEAVDTRAD
jgi:hypothetical protein